jgi:hypothetical protein
MAFPPISIKRKEGFWNEREFPDVLQMRFCNAHVRLYVLSHVLCAAQKPNVQAYLTGIRDIS